MANRQMPGLYATTQESRGPVGEDPEDTNPSAQEIRDSGSYGELQTGQLGQQEDDTGQMCERTDN